MVADPRGQRPARPYLSAFLGLAALCAACGDEPPRGPCRTDGPIGTLCGFQNPEDIEYVAGGEVIVAANMRFDGRDDGAVRGGYLSALALATGRTHRLWPTDPPAAAVAADATDATLGDPVCRTPPAGAFYPHGITTAVREGRTLVYAIGHAGEAGGREAIELLELTGRGPAARLVWRGCVPMPPRAMGNDLAVAPDGEIVVSNYQPTMSLWHTVKANVLRLSTGEVLAWRPDRGWRTLPGTAARQANGIAVSADGRFVYYSEIASGFVYRISRDGAGERAAVEIGGNPDNFTWSGRGTLLIATHTGGVALVACAFGRAPCRTPWEIHEIDPTSLEARRILAGDGDVLGAVSTPAIVGDQLYLASIFDDRIGVLPLPAR
jgi:hypothetical protein